MTHSSFSSPLSLAQWHTLDDQIRQWWDEDLHTAFELDIRNDPSQTLLFLPYPYSSAGGSEAAYPEMYAWDTYFINLALLAHTRFELVRQHILNYLFMIERYGFMPNGNRTYYQTRSQTPVFPDSIWQYYQATKDRDLLHQAYPLLKREYSLYWNGSHHQTPAGLATNRDLAPILPPVLAAEAETGLDFTPIFEAAISDCNPLITNCVLVHYATILARIATVLGETQEAEHWTAQSQERSRLIRHYCWNEQEGFFFEYNYVRQQQLPFWSLNAYWALWAQVATPQEAQRLVEHLTRFEHPSGYAVTDQPHSSPHPEFQWLQWSYPAGWPPLHIMLVDGLQHYGYTTRAQEVAQRFLELQLRIYQQTGNVYEKYNVVDGSIGLPTERTSEVPAMHGWSSASVVLLGRDVFDVQEYSYCQGS